jgi:hypothetical protein
MTTLVAEYTPPVLERRTTTAKNRVQCKQDQVVSWLQEFYTAPGNLEKLIPILQGTSEISLRLIDYFVTNYAKKMNTSFPQSGRHFLVYFNYKRELNAYSKRLFDPFCRRERIMFQARGVEPFVTTVGQLNFFRWFLEKEILEYIVGNREAIEKDMNSTLKQHYSREGSREGTREGSRESGGGGSKKSTGSDSTNTIVSSAGESVDSAESAVTSGATSAGSTLSAGGKQRKKRCELTQSAMKKVNIHECEVTVSFG